MDGLIQEAQGIEESKPVVPLQALRYGFLLDLLFWQRGGELHSTTLKPEHVPQCFSHSGTDQARPLHAATAVVEHMLLWSVGLQP